MEFQVAHSWKYPPVSGNICAAKVNFTALLERFSPDNRKLDVNSLRMIAVKKDGAVSEIRFNFIPHPNFDQNNDWNPCMGKSR